ncbi:MAG TPA: hypothetical protein VEI81_01945 [Methanoregula sp.]|nr:hypothetical protein [Methanoregula sp.]
MKPLCLSLLLLAAVLAIAAGCSGPSSEPAATPAASPPSTVPTTLPPTTETTVLTPTPTLSPYPDALPLNTTFTFGNGTKWTSEATVTRIWINDTYQAWDPDFNVYTAHTAPAGKKYLVVFLTMVDRGTDRAPLPQPSVISVFFNGATIPQDPTHPLPTAAPDSPPKIVRIGELEFIHKLYSSEYTEDYGYSHGQKQDFINPGLSNAIEGYIFFEVPASLTPDAAFVSIVFPSSQTAVWKLG